MHTKYLLLAYFLFIMPVGILRFMEDPQTPSIQSLEREVRICLFKYGHLFPVTDQSRSPSSLLKRESGLNFVRFCDCRYPMKPVEKSFGVLSEIDRCSTQHLSTFQHQIQYFFNSKLIIEPQLNFLLQDQLKFAGPGITRQSIYETSSCMLETIMAHCQSSLSLHLTRRCAMEFLEEHALYQKLFNSCQSFKFREEDSADVMKI